MEEVDRKEVDKKEERGFKGIYRKEERGLEGSRQEEGEIFGRE